ncbi:MAG: ABC transporter permease [Halanaerobiales bacterium]|nr:ABC transporter permease [Halanaerobiales bacterium]
MRFYMILSLLKKDLKDLMKNMSILPIIILPPFIAFIYSFIQDIPKEVMLPMWVLYGLAMVGIMIPGFTLAEEKEKKTLDSLLVSPATYHEIVIGKILFSLIMVMFVSLLVLAPNGGITGNQFLVWLVVILGALLFIQLGLIIGFYTESQVSASAMISPMMLFFVLSPVFMAIVPEFLKNIFEYLPNISILESVRSGILGEGFGQVWKEILTLVVWNVIAYFFTQRGVRHQFK